MFRMILYLILGFIFAQFLTVVGKTLVIYEDGYAFVLDSSEGEERLMVLNEILPNTFFILDTDVKLIGYQFHKAKKYDLESFFSKFKEFFFKFADGSMKKVKLISSSPLILEDENGMVYYQPMGNPVFPGKPSIDDKTYIDLKFKNTGKINKLKFAYIIEGIGWTSENELYLLSDDDAILFSKFSLMNNLSEVLKDVDLYLLSGGVKFSRKTDMRTLYKAITKAEENVSIRKREIGGVYNLYHIGKVDRIDPDEKLYFSNFKGKVKIERKFVFLNLNESFSNVSLAIRIPKIPFDLPKGHIRVFEFKDNVPILMGWVENERVARNGDLDLFYGESEKIVAKKVIVKRERLSKNFYKELRRLELRNYKDTEVHVDVIEHIPSISKLNIIDKVEYERRSSTEVVFHIAIPKNGKRKIEYEIEYSY